MRTFFPAQVGCADFTTLHVNAKVHLKECARTVSICNANSVINSPTQDTSPALCRSLMENVPEAPNN